jgi:hypothetical protein
LCWDYLRISPSYWLVHQETMGKIRISKRQRSGLGLAQVEQTYDVMGNVYNTTFRDWYINHARSAFGLAGQAEAACVAHWPAIKNLTPSDFATLAAQGEAWAKATLSTYGDCGALVLILPATSRPSGSAGYASPLLKKLWPALIAERNIPYKIHSESKQRLQALWQNLALVRLVAAYWQEERWRIGARFARYQWKNNEARSLDPKAPRGRPLTGESEARRLVSIRINRKLTYALRVAENAARGVFPSSAPLAASATWDFEDGQLAERLQRPSS